MPAEGGRGRWHPAAIIALFVGATLAVNLGIWLIGSTAGGTFVRLVDGQPHLHPPTWRRFEMWLQHG